MKKSYWLFLAALVIGINLRAQTGVIDADFGNRGIATTAYNTIRMSGHTSVLQPDGKIVMASGNGTNQVTLVRYSSNGVADNGFGTNGKAVVSAPAGSVLGGSVASLAVQPDGRILYAGNAVDKMLIFRLRTNGTLDSSFGTNGFVYKEIMPGWSSQIWKILVKSDGKILTGGTGTYNATKYFEVARFLSNGNIDSSFGVNGFYHDTAGPGGGCFSIALMPNGHIMAGVCIYNRIGTMSVVNLKANGIVDSTYGENGVATCRAFTTYRTTYCRLAIQHDNKILAIGSGPYRGGQAVGLVRFKTDGTPDSSFAYLGTLTTTFKNFTDLPQNVHVQPDGKIVFSGSTGNKFAIARLQSIGTSDSSYGRLAVMMYPMPGTGNIFSSFVQPDGKVVLTGINIIGNTYSFVAARFEETAARYYNTLKGKLFADVNKNGTLDTGEYLIPNMELSVVKNRFDSLTAYSSDGNFSLEYLDTGTYHSKPIINTSCYTTTSHTTSNATYFNTDNVAFALQPSPCFRDLAVSLTTCQKAIPRPGSILYYRLEYRNDGSDMAAGHIDLIKSNKLDYYSTSVPPDITIGDTMRWTFSGLLPLQTRNIMIQVMVKFPPLVQIADLIYSEAHIVSDTLEQNLQGNTSFIRQNVLSSYDPNNKIENHGGYISMAEVAKGDFLTYTVNFQNTGNDTAFNVYIHDTLSDQLDWNTLEMVTASTNYQLVKKNGICIWSFRNILLPDSNVNEAASHGWVTYRIKPKATVQIGDVINNTAAIYFDYNLPIYTNTTSTAIVANTLPLKLLSFTAIKDGKSNLLRWVTSNEVNVSRYEIERSSNGRDFIKIGAAKADNLTRTNAYAFTDNSPLNHSNYYRLKMIDEDGRSQLSEVRLISNTSNVFVSVYPNPAKENLQVQVSSKNNALMQLKVISLDGKVLLTNTFSAAEGISSRSFNISSLPRGSYFLKIKSETDEQVIKFEKL